MWVLQRKRLICNALYCTSSTVMNCVFDSNSLLAFVSFCSSVHTYSVHSEYMVSSVRHWVWRDYRAFKFYVYSRDSNKRCLKYNYICENLVISSLRIQVCPLGSDFLLEKYNPQPVCKIFKAGRQKKIKLINSSAAYRQTNQQHTESILWIHRNSRERVDAVSLKWYAWMWAKICVFGFVCCWIFWAALCVLCIFCRSARRSIVVSCYARLTRLVIVDSRIGLIYFINIMLVRLQFLYLLLLCVIN